MCAFANSGEGFLVFGIHDNGGLDEGVPQLFGRQSVKDWVEALIPKQHYPPIAQCQARFIHCSQHHSAGRGVLVISIPLSDRRPHWMLDDKESAYLRVGAHSGLMKRQTFLDISNHGIAPQGKIESLGVIAGPEPHSSGHYRFVLNPVIIIENGPPCELWAFDMTIPKCNGNFSCSHPDIKMLQNHAISANGKEPLFPYRATPAFPQNVAITVNNIPAVEITARLSVGSAFPIINKFTMADLITQCPK